MKGRQGCPTPQGQLPLPADHRRGDKALGEGTKCGKVGALLPNP